MGELMEKRKMKGRMSKEWMDEGMSELVDEWIH